MSGYRNGAELERAAKHVLEDNGYYVIKSGGSKGVVDLAAFKPGETLLVQCKLAGYIRPAERAALRELGDRLGATVLTSSWVKEGSAARRVAFWRLRSTATIDITEPWTPNHGLEGADL